MSKKLLLRPRKRFSSVSRMAGKSIGKFYSHNTCVSMVTSHEQFKNSFEFDNVVQIFYYNIPALFVRRLNCLKYKHILAVHTRNLNLQVEHVEVLAKLIY